MREIPEQRSKFSASAVFTGMASMISLGIGVFVGALFFPKTEIKAVDRRVEVPVEVIKYVDRVVEKRVEVPFDRIIEKRVEVPVEKIVEKRVEVPVERVVYRDRMSDGRMSAPSGATEVKNFKDPAAEQMSRGQAIYSRTCIACHQPSGGGLPPVFPPLAESEWVAKGPSVAVRGILHGLQGPITVRGVAYNSMMPPVMGLRDAEIADVVTYVANSFGNSAGTVTEAEVKAIRDRYRERRTPWTSVELERAE